MSRKNIEEIKISIGLIVSATTPRDHELVLECMQEAQDDLAEEEDWPFFAVPGGSLTAEALKFDYSLEAIDSDNVKFVYFKSNGGEIWMLEGIFDSEFGPGISSATPGEPVYYRFVAMDASGLMSLRISPPPSASFIAATDAKIYLDYIRSPRRVDETGDGALVYPDWPKAFDRVIKWRAISIFAANIQSDAAQGVSAEVRAAKFLKELKDRYLMRFGRAPETKISRGAGYGSGFNPRAGRYSRRSDYGEY